LSESNGATTQRWTAAALSRYDHEHRQTFPTLFLPRRHRLRLLPSSDSPSCQNCELLLIILQQVARIKASAFGRAFAACETAHYPLSCPLPYSLNIMYPKKLIIQIKSNKIAKKITCYVLCPNFMNRCAALKLSKIHATMAVLFFSQGLF
jgi:hypothetical protein